MAIAMGLGSLSRPNKPVFVLGALESRHFLHKRPFSRSRFFFLSGSGIFSE
jgi:hypothetical protein